MFTLFTSKTPHTYILKCLLFILCKFRSKSTSLLLLLFLLSLNVRIVYTGVFIKWYTTNSLLLPSSFSAFSNPMVNKGLLKRTFLPSMPCIHSDRVLRSVLPLSLLTTPMEYV